MWKAYSIPPIDFHWEMLPTVEDVAGQLARAAASDVVEGLGSSGVDVAQFLKDFQNAQVAARQVGWEGDYRSGSEPRVFWLPDEERFAYGFVWKQDNNGGTFVISPRSLDWLREL